MKKIPFFPYPPRVNGTNILGCDRNRCWFSYEWNACTRANRFLAIDRISWNLPFCYDYGFYYWRNMNNNFLFKFIFLCCRLSIRTLSSFRFSLVVIETQMFFLAIVTNSYNNNNNNSPIAQMEVKQKQATATNGLHSLNSSKTLNSSIDIFNHRYWLIELFIFHHKFNHNRHVQWTPQHANVNNRYNRNVYAERWMSNVELILLGFVCLSHDCSFVGWFRTFGLQYFWFSVYGILRIPLHNIQRFSVQITQF